MAPRATWRVSQEAGARANHGQEPLLITYHYRWNLLGADIPYGAGSETQIVGLVVGEFIIRFLCAQENPVIIGIQTTLVISSAHDFRMPIHQL